MCKRKSKYKIKDTLDAKELEEMCNIGEIIGCIVGGPFALDNAVSLEAEKHKGTTHQVVGNADILLATDIEAVNILYKSLVFFSESKMRVYSRGKSTYNINFKSR